MLTKAVVNVSRGEVLEVVLPGEGDDMSVGDLALEETMTYCLEQPVLYNFSGCDI